MLLDGVDDLLRPGADLLFVPPLEHHAQQRLGARVPNQQPAVAGEPGFDPPMTAATAGMSQVDLLADADVQQHLRIRRQIAGEIGERPSGERDRPQDVERGTQAVAR